MGKLTYPNADRREKVCGADADKWPDTDKQGVSNHRYLANATFPNVKNLQFGIYEAWGDDQGECAGQGIHGQNNGEDESLHSLWCSRIRNLVGRDVDHNFSEGGKGV